LVLGEAVRTELSRVLRQKIRVPPDTIQELDTFLRGQAILVSAAPALPIKIRDPADRVVLAEAIAGKADVLVTGDRDLLDIAARAPIPILSPRGFWDLLRNPTGETK
jgi:putative PIN family toxin of toxin-antitoxin system